MLVTFKNKLLTLKMFLLTFVDHGRYVRRTRNHKFFTCISLMPITSFQFSKKINFPNKTQSAILKMFFYFEQKIAVEFHQAILLVYIFQINAVRAEIAKTGHKALRIQASL